MTPEQTELLLDFVRTCAGTGWDWLSFAGKHNLPTFSQDDHWREFSDYIQRIAQRVLRRVTNEIGGDTMSNEFQFEINQLVYYRDVPYTLAGRPSPVMVVGQIAWWTSAGKHLYYHLSDKALVPEALLSADEPAFQPPCQAEAEWHLHSAIKAFAQSPWLHEEPPQCSSGRDNEVGSCPS